MVELTKEQKAVKNLKNNGFSARITNDTVYLCVEESEFELAPYEINFQAEMFDEHDES